MSSPDSVIELERDPVSVRGVLIGTEPKSVGLLLSHLVIVI